MAKKRKYHNLDFEEFEKLSDDAKWKSYSAVKQSRDSMRGENKRLSNLCNRINDNITWLSSYGAVAFESMAEKAGISSHPSVQMFVEAFGKCCYAQWKNGDIPVLELPDKFEIDKDVEKYSGDADAYLNAPIAELLSYLESLKFDFSKKDLSKKSIEWVYALEELCDGVLSGFKSKSHGEPIDIEIPLLSDHCEACRDMSYMALDLAQDMRTSMEFLRGDLRVASYRRIARDLYRLSFPPDSVEEQRKSPFQIKVIGEPSF